MYHQVYVQQVVLLAQAVGTFLGMKQLPRHVSRYSIECLLACQQPLNCYGLSYSLTFQWSGCTPPWSYWVRHMLRSSNLNFLFQTAL